MNYWDYREEAKKLIPRMSILTSGKKEAFKMKEKGRKSNYRQFNLQSQEVVKIERLLDTENINSFVEVSLRAQSCPMPLNIDVWDGLKCPYQCRYCFADYFRHSLYTSFFDNSKAIGLRHCAVDSYKEQLDKLFLHRGEPTNLDSQDVINAIRMEIPLRLGIRFEDFPPIEDKKEIALQLLDYLRAVKYPVMINTKSHLPGKDKYLKVLSENPAGAAIHFTMISSDDDFLKAIEPGAPALKKRLWAAKRLSEAGVRVVARIEPWMIFLNDNKDKVDEYIGLIKDAGIEHMTFDSYSYSANSKGLESNFHKVDMDFRRMFLLSADSQWLSSLLLGKFMDYFRGHGLKVSTFDQGNAPSNDDWICCAVGDHFDTGWNWGSGVIAIKYIQSQEGKPVRWSDFVRFVEGKGNFLSRSLKKEVHNLWNGTGDQAWPIYWGNGMTAVGNDEDGTIWRYDKKVDYRENLWKGITK